MRIGPHVLLFVNGVADAVKTCSICLFADDCKIFYFCGCQDSLTPLQEDLGNVFQWFTKMHLELSLHKCKVLHINGRGHDFQVLRALGKNQERVDSIRDLGFLVDDSLTFSKHCQQIVKRSYNAINFIFRNYKSRSIVFN